MAFIVTLLPQPLSPTMPSTWPGITSKLAPSTARTVPSSRPKVTCRSRTESSGAVIGGAAGSTLGQGSRANVAGAAAGAVLGAVIGSVAESRMTERTATEFTVREENGMTIAVVQANDENLRTGEAVVILRGSQVRIARDTLPPGAPARSS